MTTLSEAEQAVADLEEGFTISPVQGEMVAALVRRLVGRVEELTEALGCVVSLELNPWVARYNKGDDQIGQALVSGWVRVLRSTDAALNIPTGKETTETGQSLPSGKAEREAEWGAGRFRTPETKQADDE